MSKRIVTMVMITIIPGAAHAQTCGADDPTCALPEMITDALSNADRSGLTDGAIGHFCDVEARKLKGEASIKGVVASVSDEINNKIDANYQTAQKLNFDRAKAFVESGVNLALHQELKGMLSGMSAVFAAYPRTKAEFCATLAPETATEGAFPIPVE